MIAAPLVILALVATVTAGPALHLKLEGAQVISGVGDAIIKATLTNTGDEFARILNEPKTVLWKETNAFSIANANGTNPKFVGRMYKYLPSVEGDATVLAPGQSITVEHELANSYDFRRTGSGLYSFETSALFTLVTEKGLETIRAQTEAYEARLQGELYRPNPQLSKRITYVGCSTSQQTIVSVAANNAQSMTAESLSYLNSHNTGGTQRYTTWFGTWTTARWTVVRNNFSKLYTASFPTFQYDCTCTDSSIAYVYPSAPGQVYLCSGFWSAPSTGSNSRPGILIHEATHWTVIAGTGDYTYGMTAAKALAASNPANAISNADSYEYFAENSPPLP